MAFNFDASGFDKIKVILSIDDALNVTPEEYKEYLQTLDETKLRFVEGKQPTRFVLRTTLPYDKAKYIKDLQIKFSTNGEASIQYGFILEEVRLSLIDIENGIPFVRDNDGGASKEKIMNALIAAGVVEELYTALVNARNNLHNIKKK